MNVREYSDLFASFFYKKIQYIKNNYSSDFYIVPVPPRPGKIKKKGWDQIDDICNILKTKYHLSIKYYLRRNKNNQQKKLTKAGRITNKNNLYAIKNERVKCDKDIILIDDLITTGSTIEGCSSELKKITNNQIYALSLFRAI